MLIFYSNKRTNLNRHCKVPQKPDYPYGSANTPVEQQIPYRTNPIFARIQICRMCGRYRRTTQEEELARLYHIPIPKQTDLPIGYNIVPSSKDPDYPIQSRDPAAVSI